MEGECQYPTPTPTETRDPGPDPTPTESPTPRILILGDSLSVTAGVGLGNRLDRLLREKDYEVTTVASCGSAPASYRDGASTYTTRCGYLARSEGSEVYKPYEEIKGTGGMATPKLGTLVGDPPPDLTVIQQGTNLFRLILDHPNDGKTRVANEVAALLENLHHLAPKSGCLWIGPPKLSKYYGSSGGMVTVTEAHQQAMMEGIQQGIASQSMSCQLHDSRPQTEAPGGDGIHHSHGGQTDAWVDAVARAVEANL
jgi:hypothetical protein